MQLIVCSVFLLICGTPLPAHANALEDSQDSTPPQSIEHGNFRVLFSRFWKSGADSGHDVNIFYEGNLIPDCGGSVRWSTVEEFEHNGCSTVDINIFTGGAACCYGTYLLTSCGGREQAIILDNEWFKLEGAPAGLGENVHFSLLDTAFIEYSKEAPDGSASLQFSQSGSPAMRRLLLFDEDAWRTDKPGEFPEYYNEQLANSMELAPERDADRAAHAIVLAYLSLMRGDDAESAFELFAGKMPGIYQELNEAIFNDIAAATQNNARPLVNIDLDGISRQKQTSHTVSPGDTLHSIGRKYGITPTEIYQSNPQVQDPNLLRVGEVLRIPFHDEIEPQAGSEADTTPESGFLKQNPEEYPEEYQEEYSEEYAPEHDRSEPFNIAPDDTFTGNDTPTPPAPEPGRLVPRYRLRPGLDNSGIAAARQKDIYEMTSKRIVKIG